MTYGKPVYREAGSDESSETPPVLGSQWVGTVTVTFTYGPEKYEVDKSKIPGVNMILMQTPQVRW